MWLLFTWIWSFMKCCLWLWHICVREIADTSFDCKNINIGLFSDWDFQRVGLIQLCRMIIWLQDGNLHWVLPWGFMFKVTEKFENVMNIVFSNLQMLFDRVFALISFFTILTFFFLSFFLFFYITHFWFSGFLSVNG